MNLSIKIFRKGTKIPMRQHDHDTGADVYMRIGGIVKSHNTIIVPLGFGIEVPVGCTARFQTRTSVAKCGIFIQQCAIDAGYEGELHMIIANLSDKDFTWKKGDRLGYIEVYPCYYPNFTKDEKKQRKDRWCGSTGK